MNYRAIEDLINILVKKAGSNLNEGKALEDMDVLVKRTSDLEKRCEEVKEKIEEESYEDKDEKVKDLEEKKYLEDTIDILRNQPDEGDLNEKEIARLEEQVKLLEHKIDNKLYADDTLREIDSIKLETLTMELTKAEESLEEKKLSPSELGLKLLDAYKEGKKLDEVKEEFESLVSDAIASNEQTVSEIKDSNIFELMDNYSSKKSTEYKKLEENNYDRSIDKDKLNEKSNYHNSRIKTYKETLDAIERRKKELNELVEESKSLYMNTRNERLDKERLLNEYLDKLYGTSNLVVYEKDFNNYLDYLKEEIAEDKYLEDEYSKDVLNYKEELRNLDINNKNVNAMLLNEERCLDIIETKLSNLEDNCLEKINDEFNYLNTANRLNSLVNEQQYYYVNIDVIKNEIINIWNKEDSSDSLESTELESGEAIETSMYDEEPLESNETEDYSAPIEDESEEFDLPESSESDNSDEVLEKDEESEDEVEFFEGLE